MSDFACQVGPSGLNSNATLNEDERHELYASVQKKKPQAAPRGIRKSEDDLTGSRELDRTDSQANAMAKQSRRDGGCDTEFQQSARMKSEKAEVESSDDSDDYKNGFDANHPFINGVNEGAESDDEYSSSSQESSDEDEQREMKTMMENAVVEKPVFPVRWLGSLPLSDRQLKDRRRSATMQKCIETLSQHRTKNQPLTDDETNLLLSLRTRGVYLKERARNRVLRKHKLNNIVDWTAGQNGDSRTFAYVERDRHLGGVCHVFDCITLGSRVAASMYNVVSLKSRDVLAAQGRSAELERTVQSKEFRPKENIGDASPKLQLLDENANKTVSETVFSSDSMRGTKISCHYLGMMKVNEATGMHMLNNATTMVHQNVREEQWIKVTILVTTSALHIHTDRTKTRFSLNSIAFLGINSNDTTLGAFVVETQHGQLYAHVFFAHPTIGPLFIAIKAACELNYESHRRDRVDDGAAVFGMSTTHTVPTRSNRLTSEPTSLQRSQTSKDNEPGYVNVKRKTEHRGKRSREEDLRRHTANEKSRSQATRQQYDADEWIG